MNAFAATVTVASVPSPSQDRRALSQAWYNSLHLAERDIAGHASGTRAVNVPLSNARLFHPGKACSPTFSSRPPWLQKKLERLSRNVVHPARPQSTERISPERRAGIMPLARVVAERIKNNPSLARFVLETPQGRVMVHVVRGPEGVTVWALCPKAMHARVERALAQARLALAGMGARVR